MLLLDSAEHLAGRFAGEFADGLPPSVAEQPVIASLDEAWDYVAASACNPTVAVLATGSQTVAVAGQVKRLVERGLNVVSTCEELSFPWLRAPQVADELDELAKAHGVSVLGTGVNPGFVMDMLPVVASRAVVDIRSVFVERVVNASRRRGPLQRKIGCGMAVEAFNELAAKGQVGHVGLAESVCLIAEGLGLSWDAGGIREELRPVVADRPIETEHVRAGPGQVRGVQHHAFLAVDGVAIEMRLRMALEEDDEHDSLVMESLPPVRMTVSPGFHGDLATAAVVANTIPLVEKARPGLVTVLDLPAAVTMRS